MPAPSRHSSRQLTDTTTSAATARSEAAQALKEAAHDAYRASVAAAAPLTGAALGEMFERSPAWGTARIREVRDADIGRSQNTAPLSPHRSSSNGNHALPIGDGSRRTTSTNTNGHDDAEASKLSISTNSYDDPGEPQLPINSNDVSALRASDDSALPIGSSTSSPRLSIGTGATAEMNATGEHAARLGPVAAPPTTGPPSPRPVPRRRPRATSWRPEVPTSLIVVMVVAVATVAVVTMVTSYTHMHDLARLAGMRWLAKILPAAVDGLVVAGSASLMVDRRLRGRDYYGHPLAWAAVVIGLSSSLAANVVAVDPTLVDMRVVRWVMAGYAPLALGISGHLLLRMLGERRSGPLPLDANDVAHIISTYDAMVRANCTPDYNAMEAVAEDPHGEVGWEIAETARDLGYQPDAPDLDTLFAAAEEYRTRLAAEVASRQ